MPRVCGERHQREEIYISPLVSQATLFPLQGDGQWQVLVKQTGGGARVRVRGVCLRQG